jgi:hypothetical protein
LALQWLKSAGTSAGVDVDQLGITINAMLDRLRSVSQSSGDRGR